MEKRFCYLICAFSLAILVSCSSNSHKENKVQEPAAHVEMPAPKTDFSALAGKITDNIICDAQPQLTYCLYLPNSYSSQKSFPVIFI